MRRFTRFVSCATAMILFTAVSAFGQIPADQRTVEINSGENIAEIINGDTLAGGVRTNPARIYMLKVGLYQLSEPILFGSSNDSTSTLIIVGEEGGKKPVILTTPPGGGDAFSHNVNGSLILKNLYWPSLTTDGKCDVLFRMRGRDQRLELEDMIFENQKRGDVFSLGSVTGVADIYIKNCYFRDMTQFKNPWNYAIFTRGDKNPIDTLWVENVTVANGGLCIMNKFCPVNFAFFNHNTIQNIARYWNFMEQWKEGYFTNNLFINCLWQGEMQETMLSQLESQDQGFVHEVGILNVMRPTADTWETAYGAGNAPTIDEVKWMASDNLHFTSPFLDKYYAGEYNDTLNSPYSKVDWGMSAAAGLPLPPHPVVNIPARFSSQMTDTLVDMYEGIKWFDDTNHDQVDPDMVTKMIADQAEGDAYAAWARNNYGVAGAEEPIPAETVFSVGDYDPTTVPGPEGENGMGMANVMDLPEDFTYNADIVSSIDGKKLGAQEWWGDISDWDSDAQLSLAKQKYDGTLGVEDHKLAGFAAVTIYPNPAEGLIHLDSESELSSALFYDVTGRMVKQVNLRGAFNMALDISDMDIGVYIIQVKTLDGGSNTSKLIKK